jgi:Phage tail tube protein, TTP
MASVQKWSNVSVFMESAIATAVTITAITKANPGVVSAASHGYANGDVVRLTIQGMSQLNNKDMRVSSVTAGTFQLEDVSGGAGIDTTLFDTFGSGTAQKITYGTTISTITDVNASGGSYDFLDTTTIHTGQKSQIPGLAAALSYEFTHLWDITDPGQIALKKASDTQSVKGFKFRWPTGQTMLFAGYVGFSNSPQGSAQDKVTTPNVITAFGTPTYYST